MHKLLRQVRFSINPFLDETAEGANSYSGRPCGEGLCLFFALWIEVGGEVDEDTGFVVNVVEIDRVVREHVVPVFGGWIRDRYRRGEYIPLNEVVGLLQEGWAVLAERFSEVELSRLSLELNPYRVISIDSGNCDMYYFSEKFEFAAMHTLWNDNFSEDKNFEVFGKCANPTGHGHNYVIEVTVSRKADSEGSGIAELQRVVDKEFIELVDHKNLNLDVEGFAGKIPTIENIATFAWGVLKGKFDDCELVNVKVWETDKTCCSFSGTL